MNSSALIQKVWSFCHTLRDDGVGYGDPRTNQHFTLKTKPLKVDDLRDFIACHHAENRHERRETERFRYFAHEDLVAHDVETVACEQERQIELFHSPSRHPQWSMPVTDYLDISLAISPDLPRWPGSPLTELTRRRDMGRGDPVNDSTLVCGVHVGTHVDAPLHFLADGADVTHLALDALIGPAVVAFLPDVDAVTADDLEALKLPADTRRLLLRTRNSEIWQRGDRDFRADFVALTADAARWVVARGIRLIGVDYLSVQIFQGDPATHIVLLQAQVVIVEGLNLFRVEPGNYELICLPLKLAGAEGAPARAVLRRAPA